MTLHHTDSCILVGRNNGDGMVHDAGENQQSDDLTYVTFESLVLDLC